LDGVTKPFVSRFLTASSKFFPVSRKPMEAGQRLLEDCANKADGNTPPERQCPGFLAAKTVIGLALAGWEGASQAFYNRPRK